MKVIPDKKYKNLFRVEWPDGKISDMVNKTRAKDAIRCYEETTARKTRKQAGNGT